MREQQLEPVPLHLRNAPTPLMKQAGYGKDYLYPHDFEGHFVEQSYLPDRLKDRVYYVPTEQGVEAGFRARLRKLWKHYRTLWTAGSEGTKSPADGNDEV